jgi:hypothetical protein
MKRMKTSTYVGPWLRPIPHRLHDHIGIQRLANRIHVPRVPRLEPGARYDAATVLLCGAGASSRLGVGVSLTRQQKRGQRVGRAPASLR